MGWNERSVEFQYRLPLYGELQCISKPKISKDRCLFSVILCTPVNPTIAAAMEAKFSQRGRDLYSPKQGRAIFF
jgi:hypothetical protein